MVFEVRKETHTTSWLWHGHDFTARGCILRAEEFATRARDEISTKNINGALMRKVR